MRWRKNARVIFVMPPRMVMGASVPEVHLRRGFTLASPPLGEDCKLSPSSSSLATPPWSKECKGLCPSSSFSSSLPTTGWSQRGLCPPSFHPQNPQLDLYCRCDICQPVITCDEDITNPQLCDTLKIHVISFVNLNSYLTE